MSFGHNNKRDGIIRFISGAELKLQNKFSVALQTLPIRAKNLMQNQTARFHSKMLEVKKYSDQVRSSPDYYVSAFVT